MSQSSRNSILLFIALTLSISVSKANAAKCGDFFYNECSYADDVRYNPDASIALKDQDPIWSKLEGFWVGNYSFYDGEGKPMPSSLYDEAYGFGWPYGYEDYRGAINITIVGSRYYQHNYFFYPPATTQFCSENSNPTPGKLNVYGNGVCGVNGGFKSFNAFGTSSHEKDGTMHSLPGAGTYANYVNIAYPIDGNTLLYTSTDDSTQFHSQTNVFYPDDTRRTRTAYGFDYNTPGEVNPLYYSSLYREEKVTKEEFLKALSDFSTLYNVPPEDAAPFPMESACLTGNWAGGVNAVCPSEESFCKMDPACSESPYNETPSLNAVKVGGAIAIGCALIIIILLLYTWRQMKDVRRGARKKLQRAIGSMASEWSTLNESPQQLLTIFESIDTDGNGMITKTEITDYMKSHGGMEKKEVEGIFDKFDVDNSGGLDFAEFCSFMVKLKNVGDWEENPSR